MKWSTGVDRLDLVLRGGFPAGSAWLVHGPRFGGKEILARRATAAAWQNGLPTINVHTNRSAADARTRLQAMGVRPDAAEAVDLDWRVDAYTRAVDAPEEGERVNYTHGPLDLPGMASGIQEAQRAVQGRFPGHLILIDSVSTLAAHSDPQAVFRFLHVLLGRTRYAQGTMMMLLDADMHAARDVAMFRHLSDGAIDLRAQESGQQVRVSGADVPDNAGWIEYRAGGNKFEVIGSLAAGRIH